MKSYSMLIQNIKMAANVNWNQELHEIVRNW
jgi:hypothetical protein